MYHKTAPCCIGGSFNIILILICVSYFICLENKFNYKYKHMTENNVSLLSERGNDRNCCTVVYMNRTDNIK